MCYQRIHLFDSFISELKMGDGWMQEGCRVGPAG